MTKHHQRFITAATLFLLLSFSTNAQIGNVGSVDTWTTKWVARAHSSSNNASHLKVVRASKQPGFDRVVFEFDGPLPSYQVKYLKSHFYEGEAGRRRIRQPGSVFLFAEFFVIPASEEQAKFSEAKDFVPRGNLRLPSLLSVKDWELSEGFYDFIMGASARKPFRITELSNPSRLAIDFKH